MHKLQPSINVYFNIFHVNSAQYAREYCNVFAGTVAAKYAHCIRLYIIL